MALDAKCKVPCKIFDLPIGLKATDRFVDTPEENGRGDRPGFVEPGTRADAGYHHRHAGLSLP